MAPKPETEDPPIQSPDRDGRSSRTPSAPKLDGEVLEVLQVTELQEEKPSRRRRGLRQRIPWLFRRGWVFVVVTLVVVAVAVVVAAGKPVTYSSDAILLVNPGASSTSPGSATDAESLAATYAGLIPNDAAVLQAVSAVTGLSQKSVTKATAVTVVNGTSLLDVRFTDTSAQIAALGAAYISGAISGNHPVTKAIPSGTVTIVHGASAVTSHSTKLIKIVGLGVLLGLLLAAVIVIIWERADARLDEPDQVTAVTGIPTRSLSSLNAGAADALVDRLGSLSFSESPVIAIVGATPRMGPATERACERLQYLTQRAQFTSAGIPGGEDGDATAQQADVSILLVPREARVREVLRSKELLDQFGVRPTWALMVNSRRS